MIRCLLCLSLLFSLSERASAQDEKPAKGDKASKRLEELLKPGADFAGPGKTATPLPRATPRFLEPDATLVAPALMPPKLPLPDIKTKAPAHPSEQGLAVRETPSLPAAIILPEGPLWRWPDLLVNQFPELPVMASPQRDRASLSDPTMEVSVAFVLQPVFLPRTGSVPFTAVNLPDPFELRRTVDLRDPPAEEAAPLVTTFPRLVRR